MISDFVLLAAGGDESLPLEEEPNILMPALYDIVWSLIAFAILLFVFWKFVLPMVKKVLEERTEKIEGGIERAEAAQREAKEALDKYNEQLAEARGEAAKIREDARLQGQQILSDMKADAQKESDRIVANGQQQLQAQRQQIVTELRSDLGKQSVDLAEKLMGEQLSDNVKQSGTIDRFLADLDQVSGPGQK
ncbi:MAG TPA: F0F1 ATP synthase subunit B [Dietzia timorensis]|uniref:ATP synthase subunit b n=1 Tax=Dietzia timorensis TaxID=499555 RepID=A0A921F662_9ACTN|nr:F0F1 ATP synthase subunit B [Dietzia timorensis]HJE91618.1 F0F1 ATP synthase subunit B [Dietzia timorensis]